jgi:hypothetical protein
VFNFSTPVLIRYLCQLKAVVFLHWRLTAVQTIAYIFFSALFL